MSPDQVSSPLLSAARDDAGTLLRTERERFRRVLDGMGEGFVLLDRDFRVVEINAEALRLEGRPRDEILGRSHWEVWPDAEGSHLGRELKRAMNERAAVAIENRYVWPDGRDGWFEVRAYPDGDGLAIFYRDVTDRVRADAVMSDTERRLNAVLDNTRMAVFLMDHRQHCVYANAAAEALTGYPFADMQGRPLHDVVHHKKPDGSHYPLDECPIDRAFPERAQMDGEELFVAPDGSFYPVAFTASPVLDDHGGPIGTVIEARNIAEEKARDAELREAEGRYRLAAQATNDAIWDWRMADGHVIWNEALGTLFGHADRETSAAWWIEHIHPEDRPRIDKSIHAVIDGDGTAWIDEYRFLRADGGYAAVLDRGTVLRDEAGNAVRMIGAMLDLTQRRETEEELRRSEERYRTLFGSIEAGFCTVEVGDAPGGRFDYRVVEANPAFYTQTGFPEGVLGRWLREAAPDLEEHWYETYGRVAATGTPERFEQGSDALGRWFDVYAFRVGEAVERRVAILFNDISARRNAEERLRELNEDLETEVAARTAERDRVWRVSQDLLGVANFDGYFISSNPAWGATLGWSAEELRATPFIELIHPDDRAATGAELGRLADGVQTLRFENRYRCKDGGYRWLSWTAVPEGELMYTVARDVTADKERDAELAQAQEQLRQAQKMEAVGQLTGGIAHDFNNLLTGISGSLEMMQVRMAQGRTGDVDRYLTAAQGAAGRAAALTHRLLAFSRRQTLAPKPTDVRALVTGMEELIQRSVGPQIAVETVNAAGLWPSLIDPSQLENAVLNLCINARDAMPDGGKITVETANRWMDRRTAAERGLEPGQYVSLCVSDTGTGMTPEVAAKVFEPFFTTKPIGMGTGLGLSMIYGFAKQSGGTVSVYSEVGQGTMVCVYLPRHIGEAEGGEDGAETEEVPRAGAGETVLIIDDEPTVRMLVAEVLTDLGYTAIEAGDGAAGLKIVQSDVRIDLLVTDVGLPGGMNGRQVADAARVARPELKVLFITGYAENAVLSHGHLDPGMHVLTKPFAMEALASRIRELIGG